MGQPEEAVILEETVSLTETERELLLEFAEWYDDPGTPAEDLVNEFESQR